MTLSFRKIHIGEIPVDDLINNAFNNYEKNSFQDWYKLRNIPVTVDKAKCLMSDYKSFPNLKDNRDINRLNTVIAKGALSKFAAVENSMFKKMAGDYIISLIVILIVMFLRGPRLTALSMLIKD